jgi:phasin family protein
MKTPFTMPNFFAADALAAWENLAKVSSESSRDFDSLNRQLAENLLKKQAEMFNFAVDTSNQAIALYSGGKPLPEVFADQSRLANDSLSRIFALTRETVELVTSSQENFREWFEKGLKLLSEQAQAAGATPTPAPVSREAA